MADHVATLSILGRLVSARVRSDFQYRTSFVLFTVSQALAPMLDFAAIAVLFHQVPRLAGWGIAEVALMFGLSATAFGVADTLVGSVERVSQRIKEGTFDQLLVRPLGALQQLACEEFAFRRVGKVLQGLGVLVLAASRVGVRWSPLLVLFTVVSLVAAAVVYGSLWVATAAVAFWTVETREMANAFTYGGNFASQYPLGIYADWLRRFLVFVVPVAFVGYFPALVILDRTTAADRFGLPAVVPFCGPAVAIVTAIAARAVWQMGLRHHRSTGS